MAVNVEVSIAIITYNQEKYIKKAIDSVLNQDVNFGIEIIVGDDNSTDGTRRILVEYEKRYPDIIKLCLSDWNQGGCKNSYDTIKKCTGRYIALLEGDDYWTDSKKLAKQVEFLEKNSRCFSVSCITRGETTSGKIIERNPRKKFWGKQFVVDDFLKGDSIPQGGVLFRNTSKMGVYWELWLQGPRNMGDFTLVLGLLRQGPSFILADEMAAHVIKKDDDESNYNSINHWYTILNDMIKIININNIYYEYNYDFSYRYAYVLSMAFFHCLRERDFKYFKALYNEVNGDTKIKTLFYSAKVGAIEVSKKLLRIVRAKVN